MKLWAKNMIIFLMQQRPSTLNGVIICHPQRMCVKTRGNVIMDSDADVWTFSKMHNLFPSMERTYSGDRSNPCHKHAFKNSANCFLFLFNCLGMCWAMKIEDMPPEQGMFSPTVDLFASIVMSHNWSVPTIWKKQYTCLGYVSNFSQWGNSEPPCSLRFFKEKSLENWCFSSF